MGTLIDIAIYNKWKASGMKASKVFEFGLDIGEVRMQLRSALDALAKCDNARGLLQISIYELSDEINDLKSINFHLRKAAMEKEGQ